MDWRCRVSKEERVDFILVITISLIVLVLLMMGV